MATRAKNERDFPNWQPTAEGGRRDWIDRAGTISGFQRMVKVVDASETTLLFVQEVYDDKGVLIEHHQKFPVDTGHEYLGESE